MKIAYDGKRVFFNETGLGNYSRTLLRGLKKYFPENEYVIVSPFVKRGASARRAGEFNDFSTLTPKYMVWKYLPALWRSFRIAPLVKEMGAQIYHGLSHELPWGIERSGCKSLITVHDLIFLTHPHLYKPWDVWIYRFKYLNSFRRADLLVAVSENTKSDLVKHGGFDPEKIEVAYQSVNPRFAKEVTAKEAAQVQERYKLEGDFILYVGSLHPRKNVLPLLEAFALLKEDNLTLALGGKESPYRKLLQRRAAELGLSGRVHFLGHIPDEDLPGLYSAAKIFAYPSLYEGFGIPIIEALSCKTPVILSGDSCFRETAGAGGHYVDVADPQAIARGVEELLGDSALYKRLASEGYRHAQRFSQRDCAKAMNDIYKRLI